MILFKGLTPSIVKHVINDEDLVRNKEEFFKILKARILMSIIGNLDDAYRGYGDLDYANIQLEKYSHLKL